MAFQTCIKLFTPSLSLVSKKADSKSLLGVSRDWAMVGRQNPNDLVCKALYYIRIINNIYTQIYFGMWGSSSDLYDPRYLMYNIQSFYKWQEINERGFHKNTPDENIIIQFPPGLRVQ